MSHSLMKWTDEEEEVDMTKHDVQISATTLVGKHEPTTTAAGDGLRHLTVKQKEKNIYMKYHSYILNMLILNSTMPESII